MDDAHINTYQKQIGDTIYIIETTASDAANETVYNKLKRLILNTKDSQKVSDNTAAWLYERP